MNKKNNNIAIGGALAISALSLAISVGTMVYNTGGKVFDKDYGEDVELVFDEADVEMDSEAEKVLVDKLTKELGLEFEGDGCGTISANRVIGKGVLHTYMNIDEDGIYDVFVGMKNTENNEELNKKFEDVSKYFCAVMKEGDEVSKRVKHLYDKMSSDDYKKSIGYEEGISSGVFSESKIENKIVTDLSIYDLERPEMGFELHLSRY